MGRTSNSESIKVYSTEDGLHLSGSILWLDSHVHGELSFLSSAYSNNRTNVPQVIATEETVRLLEANKHRPNALVCPYNRPFSVGRLKMELLPSGAILGGASLYIETEHGSLIYSPCILFQKLSIARKAQLKEADTLILGVSEHEPGTQLPNRKKERERLYESITKARASGLDPIVFCDPLSSAQEITKMMADLGQPVAAHSSIYRINRVHDQCGSPLGAYSLYSKHTRGKTILLPISLMKRYQAYISEHGAFPLAIHSNLTDAKACPLPAEHSFVLSKGSSPSDLKTAVTNVRPKRVYLFGLHTKAYVDEFKGLCPDIRPLFPNDQPTLF